MQIHNIAEWIEKEMKEGNIGKRIQELLNSSKYPFTYHHDFFRERHAGLFEKYIAQEEKIMSRGEVARIMSKRFGTDKISYSNEMCKGAFSYLFLNHSDRFLYDILDAGEHLKTLQTVYTYKKISELSEAYWVNEIIQKTKSKEEAVKKIDRLMKLHWQG